MNVPYDYAFAHFFTPIATLRRQIDDEAFKMRRLAAEAAKPQP